MRAALFAEGVVRCGEAPEPALGPEELLVDVAAAGVNAADLLQRAGAYPAPPGAPADIAGLEFAGVVAVVGEQCDGFAPGDRVMAVVAGGGQGERVAVHHRHALRVPDAISLDEAGGFPEVFSTAHDALVTRARVTSGDRVLVTGAAGGVGTAAVQLASALGARVVACCRDLAHDPSLRDLGASEVVGISDVASAGPYDVVVELIGAASLDVVQRALAQDARVVVIGVGGGSRITLDLLEVMTRRVVLTGATLRSRASEEKAAVADGVARDVLPLLAAGSARVPIFARYPIESVVTAYDRFAAGGKLGKIVLTF